MGLAAVRLAVAAPAAAAVNKTATHHSTVAAGITLRCRRAAGRRSCRASAIADARQHVLQSHISIVAEARGLVGRWAREELCALGPGEGLPTAPSIAIDHAHGRLHDRAGPRSSRAPE